MTSPYFTVQEVADFARCEHRTIRRAIKSGELRASFIGGRWLVTESSIEDWFAGKSNEAARPAPQPRPRSRPRSRQPADRTGSVSDLKQIRERLVNG